MKFVRYLSQLGRFGRQSVSKHSGPDARNNEQTSFSRSLARHKMRMKCGRVYEKYVHEGTQSTPTVKKKGPRDVIQMRQIAIKVNKNHRLFFRGCRHRAKSPPPARSKTPLVVAFALLFEHMKQCDREGTGAASTREIPNKRRPATRLTRTSR